MAPRGGGHGGGGHYSGGGGGGSGSGGGTPTYFGTKVTLPGSHFKATVPMVNLAANGLWLVAFIVIFVWMVRIRSRSQATKETKAWRDLKLKFMGTSVFTMIL